MSDNRISAEHPKLDSIHCWIDSEETKSEKRSQYRHIFLKEKESRDEILDELYEYINHAHEGARNCLRAPLGDSLHPFRENPKFDPAYGYPHKMGKITLQGYFGEILAGIVAEYYSCDKKFKWEVPVFLFRTHNVGFQQLEYMKQTQEWGRQVFGRTGDDGLAFARDSNGNINGWLACEAKCTQKHSASLISDNHEKLSQSINNPIDHLRLIEALQDYKDDTYRQDWIKALRDLYWKLAQEPGSIERQNLSMYLYGQKPIRTKTWVPTDRPPNSYKSQKKLISAEFLIDDISDLINNLYSRMEPKE